MSVAVVSQPAIYADTSYALDLYGAELQRIPPQASLHARQTAVQSHYRAATSAGARLCASVLVVQEVAHKRVREQIRAHNNAGGHLPGHGCQSTGDVARCLGAGYAQFANSVTGPVRAFQDFVEKRFEYVWPDWVNAVSGYAFLATLARRILHRCPGLDAMDALHVALANATRIGEVATVDRWWESVPRNVVLVAIPGRRRIVQPATL